MPKPIALTLPQTSFGGIAFPGETWDVDGEGRAHPHEYWKTPGAANEKGGRGAYKVTIRAQFHNRFALYPDLYPTSMNKLKKLYEGQLTATLVHPSHGSSPCFIKHWHQSKISKTLSGEVVVMDFWEDQQTEFTESDIAQPVVEIGTTPAELAAQLASVKAQLALSAADQSVFDAIQNTANSVLAIKDTTELYGNLVAAKVMQLGNLCAQADGLASMQDPRAWPVVDALHNVWAATVRVANDLQSKQATLQFYEVKQLSPVSAIAIAIYNDASRGTDLMALNSDVITNPQRVPAGTQVRYYP